MKKQHAFLMATFALLLLSGTAAMAEASGSGSDVAVPDIETRIRNSGNVIPQQAIPEIDAPAPAPLPAPDTTELAVPGGEPLPAPAETVPEPEVLPEEASPSGKSPLSGFASLGAGSPGSFSGALSLIRAAGTLPALALDFSYGSADGYGTEQPGNGFFDRETLLGVRVAADRETNDWFADVELSDRSDGFQGKNPRYYNLTRRDIELSGGIVSVPVSGTPLSFSVTGDGTVYSAFAEGPYEGSPETAIADATGYRLSPFAAVTYERGNFSGELSGRYGYEAVTGLGELHDGAGALALHYAFANFGFLASVGIAGDTEDGLVVPFNVGIAWNGSADDAVPAVSPGSVASRETPEAAAHSTFRVREVHISGGIVRERITGEDLAETEPFADPSGFSAQAADWTAEGGLTVEIAVSPASALSFGAGAEFRQSLAGFGIPTVTDGLEVSSLVGVERVERASLASDLNAAWHGDGFEVSAGWTAEWLDRLWAQSRQKALAGVLVFDRSEDRIWEAGMDASFALDEAILPEVSAEGTIYPFRNFSVTLSFSDAIPLFVGEERTRNGLYAERSGELTLSAKIDF